MQMKIAQLTAEAIQLLKSLIETPSFSSEEERTAALIGDWFKRRGIGFQREHNNLWAFNKHFHPARPNLLLNSHHDTVRPNEAYTLNPFEAMEKEGKIYGLGSNDAGGCLVALLAAFAYFYEAKTLPYNLIVAATAEEESSGAKGLNSILKHLPQLDCAIVGEPTEMQLAIAEKGLLVLDVFVKGTPGHAAHPNEAVSIYNAIPVMEWFRDYRFDKISEVLGPVKMTVTQINAGKQHNVVPAECHLVVDIRVTEQYTNEEILGIVKANVSAKVQPRSLRLAPSSIDRNHPLVQAGVDLGRKTYGSPTLSDQSVLYCQSLKLGPGHSLRSHSADEFVFLKEIEEGIDLYVRILSRFFALTP